MHSFINTSRLIDSRSHYAISHKEQFLTKQFLASESCIRVVLPGEALHINLTVLLLLLLFLQTTKLISSERLP